MDSNRSFFLTLIVGICLGAIIATLVFVPRVLERTSSCSVSPRLGKPWKYAPDKPVVETPKKMGI